MGISTTRIEARTEFVLDPGVGRIGALRRNAHCKWAFYRADEALAAGDRRVARYQLGLMCCGCCNCPSLAVWGDSIVLISCRVVFLFDF